jgi:hypothetical protein
VRWEPSRAPRRKSRRHLLRLVGYEDRAFGQKAALYWWVKAVMAQEILVSVKVGRWDEIDGLFPRRDTGGRSSVVVVLGLVLYNIHNHNKKCIRKRSSNL